MYKMWIGVGLVLQILSVLPASLDRSKAADVKIIGERGPIFDLKQTVTKDERRSVWGGFGLVAGGRVVNSSAFSWLPKCGVNCHKEHREKTKALLANRGL